MEIESSVSSSIPLHKSTDAARWAAEFQASAIKLGYSGMDLIWLKNWFSNAIFAGIAYKDKE